MLFTADHEDARNTLEAEGNYIILPSYASPLDAQYKKLKANPVPENFCYASDTNTQWITADELTKLLHEDQHVTHLMRAGAKK